MDISRRKLLQLGSSFALAPALPQAAAEILIPTAVKIAPYIAEGSAPYFNIVRGGSTLLYIRDSILGVVEKGDANELAQRLMFHAHWTPTLAREAEILKEGNLPPLSALKESPDYIKHIDAGIFRLFRDEDEVAPQADLDEIKAEVESVLKQNFLDEIRGEGWQEQQLTWARALFSENLPLLERFNWRSFFHENSNLPCQQLFIENFGDLAPAPMLQEWKKNYWRLPDNEDIAEDVESVEVESGETFLPTTLQPPPFLQSALANGTYIEDFVKDQILPPMDKNESEPETPTTISHPEVPPAQPSL